jgi:hypothetical protein
MASASSRDWNCYVSNARRVYQPDHSALTVSRDNARTLKRALRRPSVATCSWIGPTPRLQPGGEVKAGWNAIPSRALVKDTRCDRSLSAARSPFLGRPSRRVLHAHRAPAPRFALRAIVTGHPLHGCARIGDPRPTVVASARYAPAPTPGLPGAQCRRAASRIEMA